MPGTKTPIPIYRRIRNYILTQDYVFKDVAEKAGIHPKRFYKLLSGTYALNAEELEAICMKGLGINPSYFFEKQFSEIEN
ncbi:helix-turn-helix transcriptional regulator [Paenibacillus kribbensis]|uniref:helix-turn-helix domain-containing protein n=1 Tax=Paenibacillus kribbensis TaxID=172713 RepID=UPI002DBFD95B|nr:helix-turn-helix transcriptional regulator [Paenibacillus kribbensis]MEC0237785.1 helix-turn-helix transcriptional regulator [Paenibacillus kribbensis]